MNILPVYPTNYGGGQSPFYTYLVSAFALLNNKRVTIFLVRLPGAILASLLVPVGYRVLRRRFEKMEAMVGAFILAVCPYFIMQGRIGLDCNSMLPISTIAIWGLLEYLNKPTINRLVGCGLLFSMTLYTYSLSFLVVSLFLVFTSMYLLYIKEMSCKRIVIWAVAVILSSFLLIVQIFVFVFDLPSIQLPIVSIVNAGNNRSGEFTFEFVQRNLLQMKYSLFSSDGLSYNAVGPYGTLYSISIPLAYLGGILCLVHAIYCVYKRKLHCDVLIAIWSLAELFMGSLIKYVPNINRLNSIYFSFVYFIILALHYMIKCVHWVIVRIRKKEKRPFITQRLVCLFVVLLYTVNFVGFAKYYFKEYQNEYYQMGGFVHSGQKAIEYAKNNLKYKDVYLDYKGFFEVYLLDNLPPAGTYQLRNRVGEERPNHYENIYFKLQQDDVICTENIYVVHKTNDSYNNKIKQSGLKFKCMVFTDYFLYYTE